MISTNSFINGVISFASNEVLPNMPNGLNKFLSYVGLGAIQKNPTTVFKPYIDMMKNIGIIKNDEVDVELLKAALVNGFKQQPTLSIAGFNFTESDIQSLSRYLV